VAATVLGCSGVTVHRAGAPGLLDDLRASLVEAKDLSPRTLQTLRQADLDGPYHRCPADAYVQLQALAVQDPQPDRLFALAEMSYHFGQKAEKSDSLDAIAYYYLCAGYAYHYLFPGQENEPARAKSFSPLDAAFSPSAFDPRFRLACDLYNAGLAKCMRAAQRIGRLDSGGTLRVPTPDGQGFTLSIVHRGFAWQPEEFGPLLFAADYQVAGLQNQYRGYGLGVPLIGTHLDSPRAPAHAFYPHKVNFPITAFFHFEGSLTDLKARRAGWLELYNPLAIQAIAVRGRMVPLETDLTTPLAYFLSRTDLNGIEYTGFLRADKLQQRTGIYMFEPYQPGKIPVVMVHGLLSSPLTWAPLFNDLRADPVLREHFQFWFYLYPTANPYLVTAADLRQTLAALRAELDPQRHDQVLDQMVFVGHSMGGLVSKLLTEDSGDDFWHLVSSQPFDSLKAQPETRAELQRIFFFEREPCIRRVVFLGTPHHGSKLSPSWPARLVVRFVQLPQSFLKAAQDLTQENPQIWLTIRSGNLPTSVDLLAPGAPALELLAARPRPPGVHFHSIIGVLPCPYRLLEALLPGGNSREGTDGVVPYSSAHLDGVDSELVIPADHFQVHQHPLAVLEVRRILLEHLREVNQAADH
jgi:pimeloyl-ACP methyl ester carboxylesterase